MRATRHAIKRFQQRVRPLRFGDAKAELLRLLEQSPVGEVDWFKIMDKPEDIGDHLRIISDGIVAVMADDLCVTVAARGGIPDSSLEHRREERRAYRKRKRDMRWDKKHGRQSRRKRASLRAEEAA